MDPHFFVVTIHQVIWPSPGTLLSTAIFFGKINNAFFAAALTHVMRADVPIPAVAVVSVLHSAAVGGSVVGDVGPL